MKNLDAGPLDKSSSKLISYCPARYLMLLPLLVMLALWNFISIKSITSNTLVYPRMAFYRKYGLIRKLPKSTSVKNQYQFGFQDQTTKL